MKVLLGIGILILLKIVAFQSSVMNLLSGSSTDSLSNNASFQLSDFDFTIINIFVGLTIVTVIFNWLRKKMKRQRTPISSLKANIALLRKEKILVPQNGELKKKRRNLVSKTKSLGHSSSHSIPGKARKLGVPSGELILAAKIQNGLK